ncbi:Ribonuclease D [Rickettsiales bacterium Ac37b]|nr:Ribonuclease D [Rickettsiales bacterium Ac37b]
MTIITTTAELNNLCNLLNSQSFITIDTEFLRDKTYFPKLCLIQIGLDNHTVIIDALSPHLDITPLFYIFNNDNIIKVFHAATQDLEIIFRLSGTIPYPIFDTQTAAMFCGLGCSISYNNLSTQLIGVQIDKTYQFTDWSLRPLSNAQITYALNDVHYLRDIYIKLRKKLLELNRLKWLEEEMLLIRNPTNYINNPEHAWIKIKSKIKNKNAIPLLQKLAAWREINAQQLDVPRGHLLKDNTLIEICKILPDSLIQLKSIITPANKHFIRNKTLKASLFNTIQESYISMEAKLSFSIEDSSATNRTLYSMLKLLLKSKSTEYNISPNIIASDEELLTISSNEKALSSYLIKTMQGWRYDIFGKYAIDLQQGKIALTMRNNNIYVIEL